MSYADLEPFYDRAEYELGVSGKAGNLQGRKIDGGNVFEAPRRREYPLPPLFVDQAGALFEAAARKLGHHPFSTPRAILDSREGQLTKSDSSKRLQRMWVVGARIDLAWPRLGESARRCSLSWERHFLR